MKTIANDCFFAWVEAEIKQGRNVRFRVRGSSMLPFLRSGKEEVLLTPCRAEKLKEMDVVLFRYRGAYVLHRIIRKKDTRFIMQGDGICTSYETCDPKDVVGVVSRIYSPSGNVQSVAGAGWKTKSRLWHLLGRWRGILLRVLKFTNKDTEYRYC